MIKQDSPLSETMYFNTWKVFFFSGVREELVKNRKRAKIQANGQIQDSEKNLTGYLAQILPNS